MAAYAYLEVDRYRLYRGHAAPPSQGLSTMPRDIGDHHGGPSRDGRLQPADTRRGDGLRGDPRRSLRAVAQTGAARSSCNRTARDVTMS